MTELFNAFFVLIFEIIAIIILFTYLAFKSTKKDINYLENQIDEQKKKIWELETKLINIEIENKYRK